MVIGVLGRGLNVPVRRLVSAPATIRNPTLAKAFGDVVRALGESKGIAQEALVSSADMDRSYLGRLERGEKQPSLDVVFREAMVLEIDARKLVSRVDKMVVCVRCSSSGSLRQR